MSTNLERKLVAIMFTDIAGFTALSSKDENKALQLLDKQQEILAPIINQFNGTIRNQIGDGLLITFPTVTDSVKCGIKIQKEIKSIENLDLRIGIHEGEIAIRDGDVFGDDVNIAARIEPFSAVGGIAISSKVEQNISSIPEYETSYLANPKLKGVSQDIKVYAITSNGLPKPDLTKVSAKLEGNSFFFVKKILFPVTGFIFTLMGAAFWFIYPFISISIADELSYDSSIAILYFENRGSSENEYFVNGLTEELINRFSRIKKLKVAPRMDVAFYKDKQLTIDQISKELDVDYLLNGSVTIIEDRIRVNLELSNTSSKEILWSDNITNNLTDIFDLQDQIAEHIKSNINILFSHDDLLDIQKRPTNNFKAYELVLTATNLSISGSDRKFVVEAKPLLEQALELDPTYSDALAFMGLIELVNYNSREDNSYNSDKYINKLKIGLDYANQSLEYNPTHPLGLALSIAIPMVLMQEENKWFGGDIPTTKLAQMAYTMRGVAVNAKTMAKAHPESPYAKTIIGLFHFFKGEVTNSKDDKKIAINLMVEAWEQIKNVKFRDEMDMDYQVAEHLLKSFLPQLWNSEGDFDKTIKLIREDVRCKDETYDCLSLEEIDDKMFLLYQAEAYEEVLKVFDAMMIKTDEDFKNQMVHPSIKRYSYYSRGMVNMKIGNYDIALESFNKALEFDNNLRRQNINRGLDDMKINHIIGYTHYLSADYKKASAIFSKLIDISDKTRNIELFSINALVEFKMGNIDKAKNDFDILEQWLKGPDKHNDYWGTAIYIYYSLFQYYQGINNNDRAFEMLKNAYDSADKRHKRQYLEYRDSGKDDKYELAKFFWMKNIVEDYEKYINKKEYHNE